MTTETFDQGENLERFNHNLNRIEELSQRLVSVMTHRKPLDTSLQGPDQDLYAKAMTGYMQAWMQNPAKVLEHQISYWGETVKHFVEAQQALAAGNLKAPEDPGPKDSASRIRFGISTPISTSSSSNTSSIPAPSNRRWPISTTWTRRKSGGFRISRGRSST